MRKILQNREKNKLLITAQEKFEKQKSNDYTIHFVLLGILSYSIYFVFELPLSEVFATIFFISGVAIHSRNLWKSEWFEEWFSTWYDEAINKPTTFLR